MPWPHCLPPRRGAARLPHGLLTRLAACSLMAFWLIAFWLTASSLDTGSLAAAEPVKAEPGKRYALVIHGGAGSSDPAKWSAEKRRGREKSLTEALRLGQKILREGGQSLDAVEQVIRHLEDDPLFNAGRGAVMNARGGHELDASIMDGRQRACGAVAGVTRVKNPISLARLVMTQTRHVLLAGAGADEFAEEQGVERVPPSYFTTEAARRQLRERLQGERGKQEEQEERQREKQSSGSARQPGGASGHAPAIAYLGTVGCVALDTHGNLAAGTSTGGLTGKKFGRVGDSPIVGAGTYADNATCAVSCTGVGEHFIRHAVAHDLSARLAYKGQSLTEAARSIIHETLEPGQGGLIAVDAQGNVAMEFNTPGMSRAAADWKGRFEVKLGR